VKKFTQIKLLLYAISHFIWRWLKKPSSLPGHIKVGFKLVLHDGFNGFVNYIFRTYLPKKYLLKTKIHIKLPSSSINSKLKTLPNPDDHSKAVKNLYQLNQKVEILIIRTGAMGDTLLTTPIIQRLYEQYDGLCLITIATRYPEVFTNNPYVTKTVSLKEIRSLEKKFDTIFDLDNCYEKNRLIHITKAYYFYIFGANKTFGNLQPELFPDQEDIRFAKLFIEEINSPYIVIHNRIDPSQPYRNVPLKEWESLIYRLQNQSQLKIIQIGSKNMDIALTGKNLVDARDIFNLQQTKEIIAKATLFLGTDAGPLHIAATTQTPIVCFFTIASHNVREPLRSSRTKFKPIIPAIECYGCQNKFSTDTEWNCLKKVGRFSCTSAFNIDEALNECLLLIKS